MRPAEVCNAAHVVAGLMIRGCVRGTHRLAWDGDEHAGFEADVDHKKLCACNCGGGDGDSSRAWLVIYCENPASDNHYSVCKTGQLVWHTHRRAGNTCDCMHCAVRIVTLKADAKRHAHLLVVVRDAVRTPLETAHGALVRGQGRQAA